MPIVPFTAQSKGPPSRPPPDEPWALMAAAQMHAEGRLIRVMDDTGFRRSSRIEDRRNGGDDNRPVRDFSEPYRAQSSLANDAGLNSIQGAKTLDEPMARR